MTRTAVHRLARELAEVLEEEGSWFALARHVLAREKRARGRVVAWTTYDLDRPEEWCCRKDCEEAVKRSGGTCVLARVVLPARKKAGKR